MLLAFRLLLAVDEPEKRKGLSFSPNALTSSSMMPAAPLSLSPRSTVSSSSSSSSSSREEFESSNEHEERIFYSLLGDDKRYKI